jgi:hypothetical protein
LALGEQRLLLAVAHREVEVRLPSQVLFDLLKRQLVGVGQEHFNQTALLVRSPHHGASGEAGWPQGLHRVSCAARRLMTSCGSLTITQRASVRQQITVHSGTTPIEPAAETRLELDPICTGK